MYMHVHTCKYIICSQQNTSLFFFFFLSGSSFSQHCFKNRFCEESIITLKKLLIILLLRPENGVQVSPWDLKIFLNHGDLKMLQ